MIRLLVGTPLRSDDRLTIKSLAQGAGLKRNKLTHQHTGLNGLFYALVRMQDRRPISCQTRRSARSGGLHGMEVHRPRDVPVRWRARPVNAGGALAEHAVCC
ncbi:hypothetical protein ACFV7R_31035 [Streptomyces sp. NPDC059866]|uniref:hypothetical protein n=1 Tax=Streptomyces sp. NPDC059866 TaxID=3346978 RepID=UPI003665F10A